MKTSDIVLSSSMAALVAVMALFPPITLFSPTPITLQTLGVMLAGSLLGAKRAAAALLIFLFLLAIGFPILAGFVGGIGLFFTPFGGYILAWPLAAFIIGWLVEKFWNKLNFFLFFLINFLGGVIVIHLIGTPWMSYVAKLTLAKAMFLSLIYIPGDILKVAIASWIATVFKKHHPLIF